MTAKIGFVILSYDKPEQLLRLATRLTSMYDAPIVCHHNFDQCDVDFRAFPENVSVCRPHIPTRWGDVSCIQAARRALRMLYEKSDPEWFVLLSGSDYPVASARRVLGELGRGEFDAYMEYIRVRFPSKDRFACVAYDRYIAWRLQIGRRVWFPVRDPRMTRIGSPFRDGYSCFAGDHWITANRRSARALLDCAHEPLLKHLARRPIPEECFYQTVLCNDPDLRISGTSKRYRDWSQGGGSPKMLGIEDIPAILNSGAFFARKFDMGKDAAAMDRLDLLVDQSAA